MDITGRGQVSDFDFLLGNWTVENRRLKQRHVGSDEWDIFPATQQFWKL
ncbi:MAG: Tat (twin-arginine translocation) pathway signal sequence domain protein, partial [Devosia sp.]|nr:Tat (twin-arginine translocation) pathway signal sequence domain protein [Devosia sp.]